MSIKQTIAALFMTTIATPTLVQSQDAVPSALIEQVKAFEGLRLLPYDDLNPGGTPTGEPEGTLTVGYGCTRDVVPGRLISEAEAEACLAEELREALAAVDRLATVPLNANERQALASFVFNVGAGAFADSTLLRRLNAGDRWGAVAEFDRWIFSKGRRLNGLVRRRAAEKALFLTPVEDGAEAETANPFGVFRYYHSGVAMQSYSSWFPLWGGIAGAGHSVDGIEGRKPPRARGDLTYRPDGLDAALYDATFPAEPPQGLEPGDRVRIYGFPAGSEHLATRTGYVHLARPGVGSWVVVFDDDEELAVAGMSGGAVSVVGPDGSETLAAILVTQNGRADVDLDGDQENGADVVSLRDVWEAVRQGE